MEVDWGFAGQVGGIGFSLVFLVLAILAVVIWLMGIVISRVGSTKAEPGNKKKGD